MAKPIVSVLTTVYNRNKYLAQAIESVMGSTFTNWELVIVDDCSKDNSIDIAREYEKRDKRIKVYQNESNLGDYGNRNKAAALANGKYIKYLDADDMIYPNSLEIMVSSMEKFPDAALGISQEVFEDYNPYPFVLSPYETYKREFLQRGVLGLGPTGTIIKKKCFDQVGGFSGTRYIGDTELWLELAANYSTLKLQSGLIFWRKHENQEFNIGHLSNSYIILNYQVRKAALKNEKCPLDDKEKQQAIKRMNFRHGRDIINLAVKRKKLTSALSAMKSTSFDFIKLIMAFLPWRVYSKL